MLTGNRFCEKRLNYARPANDAVETNTTRYLPDRAAGQIHDKKESKLSTDLAQIQNARPQLNPAFFVTILRHGSPCPSQRGGLGFVKSLFQDSLETIGSMTLSLHAASGWGWGFVDGGEWRERGGVLVFELAAAAATGLSCALEADARGCAGDVGSAPPFMGCALMASALSEAASCGARSAVGVSVAGGGVAGRLFGLKKPVSVFWPWDAAGAPEIVVDLVRLACFVGTASAGRFLLVFAMGETPFGVIAFTGGTPGSAAGIPEDSSAEDWNEPPRSSAEDTMLFGVLRDGRGDAFGANMSLMLRRLSNSGSSLPEKAGMIFIVCSINLFPSLNMPGGFMMSRMLTSSPL